MTLLSFLSLLSDWYLRKESKESKVFDRGDGMAELSLKRSDFMAAAGRSWAETLGEFTAWLDEAGIAVEGLPDWHQAAPVRVVTVPGLLLLERMTAAQFDKYKRMIADGKERMRALPFERLRKMHPVRITDVDVTKMRGWQGSNEQKRQ